MFFILSKEQEKHLWEDGIIVFDTNAICSLYRMTKPAKDTMLEILNFLKERIWIPAHVYYEYRKNRLEVIKEPLGHAYNNPRVLNNNYMQEAQNYLKKLKEKKYYHPFFDEDALKKLEELFNEISKEINDVKELIKSQYSKRKEEIGNLEKKDEILKTINKLNRGPHYEYAKIIDLMHEGEWRYRQQLPPGYEDAPTKQGMQKYGDLIIWKQVIDYAKENKKPIIFITNDVKTDWYVEHKKEDAQPCPRHELLLEFKEQTGQDIWLYTLNRYIERLAEVYKDDERIPFYEGLDAVRDFLAYDKKKREQSIRRKINHIIGIECGNCGHHFEESLNDHDWIWELENTVERGMGVEKEYSNTISFDCPECGNECSITFNAFEYPIGVFNGSNYETDGCLIDDKVVDISDFCSFEEMGTCSHCGQEAYLDENGLCPECAEAYQRLIDSDD